MTLRVGLLPHPERAAARELAQRAAGWLVDHGAAAVLPDAEARAVGRPDLAVDPEGFPAGLDVVVSLGGDGTMLRAIDRAYAPGVPVLGVNVGQMGYLTEVEPADLQGELLALLPVEVKERYRQTVDVLKEKEAKSLEE